MRGVCVDALNPYGRPSPLRLARLGANSVRLELRDHPDFYDYYEKLARSNLGIALLIGPSTENLTCYQNLIDKPNMVIIGNEPDSMGSSSWAMTPERYIDLWNQAAWATPDATHCAAGMLHGPEFLEQCWSKLQPKPDFVNIHYPDKPEQIASMAAFNVPVICGEWCWRGGTGAQITAWQAMLNQTTTSSFWFCWSDGMVPGMGLLDRLDRNKQACYHRYKRALTLPT